MLILVGIYVFRFDSPRTISGRAIHNCIICSVDFLTLIISFSWQNIFVSQHQFKATCRQKEISNDQNVSWCGYTCTIQNWNEISAMKRWYHQFATMNGLRCWCRRVWRLYVSQLDKRPWLTQAATTGKISTSTCVCLVNMAGGQCTCT